MAKHNVTEASNLVGKNRKTIQRYMSSGKISYTSRPDGRREIDTSELIRVFGLTKKIKDLESNVAQEKERESQSVALILKELKEIRKENKELRADNRKLNNKLDSALQLLIEHDPKVTIEKPPKTKKEERKKTTKYKLDMCDIPSFFSPK